MNAQDVEMLHGKLRALRATQALLRTGSRKVVYERRQVLAYFDADGRSVESHFAAYAKRWTPDGKVTILLLDRP